MTCNFRVPALAFLLLGFFTCGCSSVYGELLAYDSFDYRLGTAIQPGGTLGGAEQGFANAWLFTGYAGEIVAPLEFPGIAGSGNALRFSRNDGGLLFRGMDRELSAGTYYMSMIFLRTDADNGGSENWSIKLQSEASHSAGPASAALLTAGTTSAELPQLKVGSGDLQTGSSAYAIGTPVFMLLKFSIDDNGSESAALKWYNDGDRPPTDESEISWDVTAEGEFSGGAGWKIGLPAYIGAMTIDEFRLGTELADVIYGKQNETADDGEEDYQKVLNHVLLSANRYRFNTGDASNQCITMDISAADTNGAPVFLQNPDYRLSHQQWVIEELGDNRCALRCAYEPNSVYLCADSGGDGWSAGDSVQARSWSDAEGFYWTVLPQADGRIVLQLQGTGFCLTRSSSAQGTPVTIAVWNGADAQMWTLDMRENVQSPSITRGTDGSLLAMFKYLSVTGNNGMLYASENDGKTWSLRKKFDEGVYGQTVFVLNNALYMIYGESGAPTQLKLAKSTDHGFSWSTSVIVDLGADVTSGGAEVVILNGILYYGFIDRGGPSGSWSQDFRLCVASCPANSDLMVSGNWTITDPLAFPSSPAVSGTREGWMEPNCVPGPDGRVWMIARVDKTDTGDVAAVLKVSEDRTQLEFVNRYPATGTATGFIHAPWAGCSKFHILYDEVSGRYLALSNPYLGAPSSASGFPYVRNILALYESTDLKIYRLVKTLINDDVYEDWEQSSHYAGFQYPAFMIDGSVLRYVSRTAYRTYKGYHDANYGSYHELKNFRNYLSPDGEIVHYRFDNPDDPGYNSAKMRGTGADVNGAAYSASGRYGGCLSFDGTNDFLGLMNRVSPKLHRASKISLSVWMKNDTVSAGPIFTSAINDGQAGPSLQLLYGKLVMSARSTSSDELQTRRFSFPGTGEWHHIVAQWDFNGDTMRLWLDRVEQTGTETVSFKNTEYIREAPAQQDRIGGHFNGSTFFKGSMDEFRLFSRELSQSEINAFYNGLDNASGFLFMLRASNR
ncbi:MAG: LamG-like jellyroll fold domain-containing protein [Kiritimatiellales bacterium]